MKNARVLDLFAGIGSMTLAAENVGFSVVCAVGDSKEDARIYKRNFGDKLYLWDSYETIDISKLPEVDYIFCKLPGKYLSQEKREIEQIDGKVKFVHDVIKQKQPKAFFIVIAGGKSYSQRAVLDFAVQIGYEVRTKVLDSKSMTGMPVNDKNTYMIGMHKGVNSEICFPDVEEPYKYDLNEIKVEKDEGYDLSVSPHIRSQIIFDAEAEVYNYLWNGKLGFGSCYMKDEMIRYHLFYPTLLKDKNGVRRIKIRELARTKFFPDEFNYEGVNYAYIYRALIRSVNISIAQEIARCIYEMIENSQNRVNQTKKEDNEQTAIYEEKKVRRIFLSYCQKDSDIADLIENRLFPYICEDYRISRDVRDVTYKESFRKFMESIQEHEYVMMIISDRYLKSLNCMFEMLEVFKDSSYGKKLLFFVLSDKDKRYYKEPVTDCIAAEIYSIEGRTRYMIYWQERQKQVDALIDKIGEPMYAREQIKEKSQIEKIKLELNEFFEYISDVKGLSLDEHLNTDFRELRKIIYRNK